MRGLGQTATLPEIVTTNTPASSGIAIAGLAVAITAVVIGLSALVCGIVALVKVNNRFVVENDRGGGDLGEKSGTPRKIKSEINHEINHKINSLNPLKSEDEGDGASTLSSKRSNDEKHDEIKTLNA
jgi:hypothetical protein